MKEKWTIILVWLFVLTCQAIQAQEKPSRNNIKLDYAVCDDGRAEVSGVTNNSDYRVTVQLMDDGVVVSSVSVPANGSKGCNVTCSEAVVDADGQVPSFRLLKLNPKPVKVSSKASTTPGRLDKTETSDPDGASSRKSNPAKEETSKRNPDNANNSEEKETPIRSVPAAIPFGEVIGNFQDYVESIAYLSDNAIREEEAIVGEHVVNLQNWKDVDGYISKEHLDDYLEERRDTLLWFNDNIDLLVTDFIDENYPGKTLERREECFQQMRDIVSNKLKAHEENVNLLSKAMGAKTISLSESGPKWWLWLLVALVLAGLGALVWWRMRRGGIMPKKPSNPVPSRPTRERMLRPTVDVIPQSTNHGGSGVTTVRITNRVPLVQNIDDVVGNDQYMAIDTSDFCDDSAVRRIYLKNTCIKEIYNMYAEDLRNPDNPMEDGCLVVGRWVYDEKEKCYDVTLEQVVFPGDDAVFSEYEFSFGAKIKIKMREKLRRLRRETSLQYDNTCWVHSHPGLGVFFSNADLNSHEGLKDPFHPMLLTAFVIDILTPEQELGIFTFKRDGSIASKLDLKKLYSLEQWYQWAMKSDRWSFKAGDYYDLLADAKEHDDNCLGIHLSNGAVIDMAALTSEGVEMVAWMQGTPTKLKEKTRHLVSAVKKKEDFDGPKPTGAFVITEQKDFNDVEKAVGADLAAMNYVLVCAPSEGVVTALPVVDGKLCKKEEYYGKQQLQELKIWTRRKR